MIGIVSALTAVAAQEPPRNLVAQQAAPSVSVQEQRVALVIGNNAYQSAPLLNPVNDARAMAEALRATGFKVTLRTDVGHRDFLVAMREFGDALRRGGVGVFYYAGHGMQIKGRNYLIPADAVIEREDEVAYAAVDAQAMLDKMETAGNSTNLMILDACRNNPFGRSFRSSTQGLAQMDAPVGTLVAFATAPGTVASDGQGANGLYTQHLLRAMRQPGLKVEDVFKQTRSAVRLESQGKQIPWESTSLEGDFYYVAVPPAASGPASAPVDTDRAVEDAFWASVKDSRDPAELHAFLKRYPQGAHAALARERLAALQPQASPSSPSAAASVVAPATVQQLAARPSRPAAPVRGNALGYTVGDKWNYQVVDRWKGEVVRNFAYVVERIGPDGGWAGAGVLFDEAGRVRRFRNAGGDLVELSPHDPRWWPGMKVGDTMRLAYEVKGTSAAGRQWLNRVRSEGRVLGREKIRVPAGEFDALRVEIKAEVNPVGRPGYGHFTSTYWYAPELHTMVAREEEVYWNGKIDVRQRDELTSLRLMNHPDYR